MTAYGGTFLVDPNTAELVHLAIRTEGLASETRACEAATTLDYGHVRLNATEFLLPSAVRLEIVDTNGTDSINRSVFTECHEFVGVSTVTFEAPPQTAPTAAKTAPASQAFALPPGIQFKVALAQDVDSGKAAAGDPIKAKVVGAIHDRSHRLLVPSGAAVAGRIVEIRRYYAPTPSLLVGIKLETVSVGGTLHPLEAHAVPVERPLPAGRLTRSASLRGFVGILRSVRDPGTAVLGFRDVQPDYVIGKGQESSWVTAGHEQAVPGLNAAAREAGPTLPPPSDTPAATTPGAPIPGWRLAGSVPQCYQVGVDRETRHGGGASGTIRSVTPNCLGFGTLMQTFQAQEFRERRVRLSAWVKTRDAGRASLWMRVDDDDGAVLAFDNMDRRSKRGTTGWHKEEIVLDVPHRAASINFGVLLAEHGQAWVDDMMFEVVDKKVKSTPMPVAQAAGRSDPNAHRNRANLPASPENLDFER